MMTELTTINEHVTAVLTSRLESGEDFEGAILIGYYPGSDSEIWIEAHGQRTNIQLCDVDAFCKQLKRAKLLAAKEPQ